MDSREKYEPEEQDYSYSSQAVKLKHIHGNFYRFHIPIITDEGTDFIHGEESYILEEGNSHSVCTISRSQCPKQKQCRQMALCSRCLGLGRQL